MASQAADLRRKRKAEAEAEAEAEDDEEELPTRKRRRHSSGRQSAGRGRSKQEAVAEAHNYLTALLNAALERGLALRGCPVPATLATNIVQSIPPQKVLRLPTKRAAEQFLESLPEEALGIARDLEAWQRMHRQQQQQQERRRPRQLRESDRKLMEETLPSLHPSTLRRITGKTLCTLTDAALSAGNADLGLDLCSLISTDFHTRASKIPVWHDLLREWCRSRQQLLAFIRTYLPSPDLWGGALSLGSTCTGILERTEDRRREYAEATARATRLVATIRENSLRLKVALATLQNHIVERGRDAAACLLVWDPLVGRTYQIASIAEATAQPHLPSRMWTDTGNRAMPPAVERMLAREGAAAAIFAPSIDVRSWRSDAEPTRTRRPPSSITFEISCMHGGGIGFHAGLVCPRRVVSLQGIFEFAAAATGLHDSVADTKLLPPLQRLILSYVGLSMHTELLFETAVLERVRQEGWVG